MSIAGGIRGDAQLAVDAFGLPRDECGHPVLVGDAKPAALGRQIDLPLLLPALVALQLELGKVDAQDPDGAFMNDVGLAQARREAHPLNRGVRRHRDRGAAAIGHPIGDREHELRVDRDGSGKDKAAGRGVGECHRMLGGQVAAGGGPQRLAVRKAGQIGAHPALLGEIGVRLALRPQQLHQGRSLGNLLVIALEEEVIDAGALEGQGAGQGRGIDPHPGALGQGLGAGQSRRRRKRGGQGGGDFRLRPCGRLQLGLRT